MTYQPGPPLKAVGTLCFQGHFGDSERPQTHYPDGIEIQIYFVAKNVKAIHSFHNMQSSMNFGKAPCMSFYGFLVRILIILIINNINKVLHSHFPTCSLFLCCCMHLRPGESGCENIPEYSSGDLTDLRFVAHLKHASRRLIFCCADIPFPSMPQTLQAFPCSAHKDSQPAPVISLYARAVLTFYQGSFHFWIYHYSLQPL